MEIRWLQINPIFISSGQKQEHMHRQRGCITTSISSNSLFGCCSAKTKQTQKSHEGECRLTASVGQGGTRESHVWHGLQILNRLDCFQRLLPEKDFALYLGQYGKLCPLSSRKGQRYFEVKKGHLWQLYPIQRDKLSPKEHEEKNPYLFYFCVFDLQLPWCVPDMELSNVFKQNPAGLS